ncbi:uncharacterized protein LOC110395571 [Numida meleagris]|uniref:uncharacterized protein LOC110395571 n=1 Tax=Numida meleagris TaxID=8996 RepID=UPI000B3E3AC5|nr:uncharacterized protein LOC110395571 [Numida meleagris]
MTSRLREVILPLYSAPVRPYLGAPTQEGHGVVGEGPEEGHEGDQRAGAPSLQGRAKKAGHLQPGEENVPGGPYSSLQEHSSYISHMQIYDFMGKKVLLTYENRKGEKCKRAQYKLPRLRIPETGNKSLQHSQEHHLNLLLYYIACCYNAARNIKGTDGHHLTSICNGLLPLVTASHSEKITCFDSLNSHPMLPRGAAGLA